MLLGRDRFVNPPWDTKRTEWTQCELSMSSQFTSEPIFTTKDTTITVGRTEGSDIAVDTHEGKKWGSARLSSAWGGGLFA